MLEYLAGQSAASREIRHVGNNVLNLRPEFTLGSAQEHRMEFYQKNGLPAQRIVLRFAPSGLVVVFNPVLSGGEKWQLSLTSHRSAPQ